MYQWTTACLVIRQLVEGWGWGTGSGFQLFVRQFKKNVIKKLNTEASLSAPMFMTFFNCLMTIFCKIQICRKIARHANSTKFFFTFTNFWKNFWEIWKNFCVISSNDKTEICKIVNKKKTAKQYRLSDEIKIKVLRFAKKCTYIRWKSKVDILIRF